MNGRQEHAECSAVIAAVVGRIWSLVSHPEWVICHGPEAQAVIDGVEPGDRVVLDDRYRSPVIHMVTLHEPSYAAFRWGTGRPPGRAKGQADAYRVLADGRGWRGKGVRARARELLRLHGNDQRGGGSGPVQPVPWLVSSLRRSGSLPHQLLHPHADTAIPLKERATDGLPSHASTRVSLAAWKQPWETD
ncbi:MAG: hypothetical protein JWQ56_177 [Pseudarthrobacter sp.]|nr:hypothetical protein [Pseudarthrobacter sp.]